MDFLNMNFSTLFLERHGKLVYDSINKQIMKENSTCYNEEYIEIIFKVAFLSFWGLAPNEIKKMIEHFMSGKQVDIGEINSIHKKSISKIQKYLREATENPKQ